MVVELCEHGDSDFMIVSFWLFIIFEFHLIKQSKIIHNIYQTNVKCCIIAAWHKHIYKNMVFM